MFERPEIAAALFFVGLALLLVGGFGVSVWVVSNIVAMVLGGVMLVLGLVWWQLLRRRPR